MAIEDKITEQLRLARVFGYEEAIDALEEQLTKLAERRFPGCGEDSDRAFAKLWKDAKSGDSASLLFVSAIAQSTANPGI